MISDKVRPHHLERKAILYVRQSSAHQVLHNRESSALQYAMRDRLTALGWSEVEVIDDDLGRSAAGGVQRAGFKRMVAEVCLGKVGAVCAREVSRFARNSRDWQQLIEMCRVVDTVLVDQETIYAPRHGNDRLLLGLKGSLNEYELDLLRQRSLSARYEKARRGELVEGRIKLTDSRDIMNARIRSARQGTGDGWPEFQYLWDVHPAVDWLSDKVSGVFGRRQAPVARIRGVLPSTEVAFVFNGIVPNLKGQPLVDEWPVVVFSKGRFARVEAISEFLKRTVLGKGELPNVGDTAVEDRRLNLSQLGPAAHPGGFCFAATN